MTIAESRVIDNCLSDTPEVKRLAAQYRKQLVSFFSKRLQSHWDAEELTQEVFYKIIKHGKLGQASNLEAYIYTIAGNVLKDKIRSDKVRSRNSHVALDEELTASEAVPVEQVIDNQNRYKQFLGVLETLHPRTRTIFLLNRYEGVTYSEIAQRYGISSSAVEKHMMKALTSIRNALRTES